MLVTNTEVPEWHMANPNIKTGYRRSMPLYDAIKSMTQWHNETLNIHTHLLVGLYFLYVFLESYKIASFRLHLLNVNIFFMRHIWERRRWVFFLD